MWFLLVACRAAGVSIDDTETVGDTAGTDTANPVALDLREAGPSTYATTEGTFHPSNDCDLDYVLYTPEAPVTDLIVVLTHGFMRTNQHMADWAEHYASWGLTVVTPTSCHAVAWDVDQEQNGQDNIELAASLGATRVLYAGHSAGGLASWVAAANDPHAVGLFGLDPVDVNGIGARSVPDITAPTYALYGDSSVCNANGPSTSLTDDLPGSQAYHLVDADHCDFESPTDSTCAFACGSSSNERFTDAQIHASLRGLSTAALLDAAGLADVGPAWWAGGGTWNEELASAGAIGQP